MPDGMTVSREDHQEYDPADAAAFMDFAARHMREDAFNEPATVGIWFARQLDYVKTKVYNRKLPSVNADRLVPDETDVPEWAETITIRQYDAVGMAKIISNYADDLPRADVRGAEKTVTVKTIGDSYGYNVNELRASRATGVGLDQKKADAARRAIDLKIASVKLQGDAVYNLFGIFTHPNIPVFTFPNVGAWSGLTGDQIYQNLVAIVSGYQLQTLGVHTPDHLVLAPAAYIAATSKFVTSGAGLPVTAMYLFITNFPGITVENVWEATGANSSGKDVALLYERSTDNIAHQFVMPFSQLPPEARNLEIVTDCLARTGGVQVYYPLSLLQGVTS